MTKEQTARPRSQISKQRAIGKKKPFQAVKPEKRRVKKILITATNNFYLMEKDSLHSWSTSPHMVLLSPPSR